MGLFDFGGSKSSSRSNSFSSSFDNLDQFGLNFGANQSTSRSVSGGESVDRSFGRSDSGSVSGGRSFGTSSSRDRVAFEETFRSLFGNATLAAAGVDAGNISDAASLLFSSGGGFLENLETGGAGQSFLENRLGSVDNVANDQIAVLEQDLGRFLSETALPQIGSRGIVANTLGGSRGDVAEGIAVGEAAREFTRGVVDIRTQSQEARDAIAAGLVQSDAQRAGAGISALPSLFGLAEGGELAALSPFGALSGILGPVTSLTASDSLTTGIESAESFSTQRSGSEGRSTQFAQSLSDALGFNFGIDSTTGRAGSTSRSSSSSSSKSASFGFG